MVAAQFNNIYFRTQVALRPRTLFRSFYYHDYTKHRTFKSLKFLKEKKVAGAFKCDFRNKIT